MKRICFLPALVWLLMVAGCSTQKSVAGMEGWGPLHVYNAGFDPVWNAALAAVEKNGFHVVNANRAKGYIGARRGISPTAFGENLGIWVRGVTPFQTEVGVVSRHAGLTILPLRNWQQPILKDIATVVPT
ncbi:MAG: hypothetical protein JWR69_1081 [Pedosphaera sp.]|nr:hypothetical protein [Pedosphaera sp.]